jgi:hypothetical protein
MLLQRLHALLGGSLHQRLAESAKVHACCERIEVKAQKRSLTGSDKAKFREGCFECGISFPG